MLNQHYSSNLLITKTKMVNKVYIRICPEFWHFVKLYHNSDYITEWISNLIVLGFLG